MINSNIEKHETQKIFKKQCQRYKYCKKSKT